MLMEVDIDKLANWVIDKDNVCAELNCSIDKIKSFCTRQSCAKEFLSKFAVEVSQEKSKYIVVDGYNELVTNKGDMVFTIKEIEQLVNDAYIDLSYDTIFKVKEVTPKITLSLEEK